MTITLEDMREFIKERGLTDKCPVCPKEEWHFNPEQTGSLHLNQLSLGEGGLKGFTDVAYIPVVSLFCMNCGYIRFHAKAIIDIWKKSQNRE